MHFFLLIFIKYGKIYDYRNMLNMLKYIVMIEMYQIRRLWWFRGLRGQNGWKIGKNKTYLINNNYTFYCFNVFHMQISWLYYFPLISLSLVVKDWPPKFQLFPLCWPLLLGLQISTNIFLSLRYILASTHVYVWWRATEI